MRLDRLRRFTPRPLLRIYDGCFKHPRIRRKYGLSSTKHAAELHFWMKTWRRNGERFLNGFYEDFYPEVGGLSDPGFVRGLVVADFGCGPQGSLEWATRRGAVRAIGIDVLAESYSRWFDVSSQDMEYVASTETGIPLEEASVDLLFAVNALDHCDDVPAISNELRRILRTGGLLIASFNLDEPPTACEPATLSRSDLDRHLLHAFDIEHSRLAPRGPRGDPYRHCRDHGRASGGKSAGPVSGSGVLWLRARKRA